MGTPLGFKFRRSLKGHNAEVNKIEWSKDGISLASASQDGTAKIWNTDSGEVMHSFDVAPKRVYCVGYSPEKATFSFGTSNNKVILCDLNTGVFEQELTEHEGKIYAISWSDCGNYFATGGGDNVVVIWRADSRKIHCKLKKHEAQINSIAWCPGSTKIATCSDDENIIIWDVMSGKIDQKLNCSFAVISCIAWSPDGSKLASSGADNLIRIWDPNIGKQEKMLEGHTDWICSLSFSSNGNLLASKSRDGTVRLWRTDNWEIAAILPEISSGALFAGISFHPSKAVLATLDADDNSILIWELDYNLILRTNLSAKSIHYSNAKVILVGDTGVGKTGLSLVLTGKPWAETGSSHGRRVWLFQNQDIKGEGELTETREILLWDLAGQPDYRLIHQLHLTEVTVALIIFDSRSQTDPFAGISHWVKSLDHAQQIQGNSATIIKKILVAARTDVGKIGVSTDRIKSIMSELAIDEYFETSAKENWGIAALTKAIPGFIDWDALPKVSSTEFFLSIKGFLTAEKETGRLITTANDLYLAYIKSLKGFYLTNLHAEFITCIKQIESRGLIKRLSFGNFVLLQPELLDSYASAMANAAKGEPSGLGSIQEKDAREGLFFVPAELRISDVETENLLLLSTIEELLKHEIAFREQGEDGSYLIFPSHLTRENSKILESIEGNVVLTFQGPISRIYATLSVRLVNSRFFTKGEMWKNGATYIAKTFGICGLSLREFGEGSGEITLFFDNSTSEETRFYFEEFVITHLQKYVVAGSLNRKRKFICTNCQIPINDRAVSRRLQLGFDWINCNVCDSPQRISLLDREERLLVSKPSPLLEMTKSANSRRTDETSVLILEGKILTQDFDVFLCYNNVDKQETRLIGAKLKNAGILPWFDEWELRPGFVWQDELQKQISKIKSVAIFVGYSGIGPWQLQELNAFIREFVERGCNVIPVILSTALTEPELPIFLKGIKYVDFRIEDPDPIQGLIWGITGERVGHTKLSSI